MKRNTRTALAVVLGLSASLPGGSAVASTLSGVHVSYSFDETALGLFGTASVAGDSLVFAPAGFLATAPAPTYQTVTVTVTALAGYQLSSFGLTETGGYSLSGPGDQVYLAGNIEALDIEGNTSNNAIGNIVADAPFDGATGTWTAQAGIVLPATGWGGGDGIVTSVNLTLSNQLFAVGGAEIWKDAVSLAAVTAVTPVPEADTYAMMLAGLGLVGFLARRARFFA